jgi:tRNA nucleotidyltransferase (CCA-adding enzyme)
MSAAVSNAIKRSNTIVLTEKEDKLFTLLDQFSKSLKQSSNIEVECRVAGGWVRDKV